jgi:serine/threonine protein phosphatase PrpC
MRMVLAATDYPPHRVRSGNQHTVLNRESGQLFIIAEGDSTRPCAWRAAEVAIQQFVAVFVEEDFLHVEMHARLTRAARAAQRDVAELYGVCEGAKAAILAVFVSESEQTAWYYNDGAAQLYRIRGTETERLLGEHEVVKTSLEATDSLLLLSSGLNTWANRTGAVDFAELAAHPNLQTELDKIVQQAAKEGMDDATAIFLV